MRQINFHIKRFNAPKKSQWPDNSRCEAINYFLHLYHWSFLVGKLFAIANSIFSVTDVKFTSGDKEY